MKVQILDIGGKKLEDFTTPLFEEPIREDIIFKIIESEKVKASFSPKMNAGMDISASGNIRHKRHSWKSDRGRGLSRVPRKIFWRRGTQFSWEAAIIPGTKGGRRAHPPKGYPNSKKINKKEIKKAILSALTYSNSIDELKNKYKKIKNKELQHNLPLIVENKFLTLNTRESLISLKKILGSLNEIAIQKKKIRAGIGKLRGRKYKHNAGLLFVIGKNQNTKLSRIDIVKTNELMTEDLANNGARITLFTKDAIKELETILLKTKSKEMKNEPHNN